MQQSSKICTLQDHNQLNIIHVCAYKQCKTSRFLCSICIQEGNHKHDQSDNSHILDSKSLYDKIQSEVSFIQGNQVFSDFNPDSINCLKKLTSEILIGSRYLKVLFYRQNQLEEQLQNIQQNGFENITDQALDQLINLHIIQDFYSQLLEQTDIIIQEAKKINEWRLELIDSNNLFKEQIKDASYQLLSISDTKYDEISTLCGAISHDLKYIVSGNDNYQMNLWNDENCQRLESIKLEYNAYSCRFTDDSSFLYVEMGFGKLYQFDVKNNFTIKFKENIQTDIITQIYCISNTILLTCSLDKTIVRIDINREEQIFKIQAHNNQIYGLDYNRKLNVIVSGSNDKSIKLWNGQDQSLIIEKQDAHNYGIHQVLFIIDMIKTN